MTFDRNSDVSSDDHIAVTDTLLRFGAGVDDGDKDLLSTAFSDDAVVDFGPCGRKMGLDFPLMTGGKAIISFLGSTASTQITSHVVTNARVHVDGSDAKLRALVDATHHPKGDHTRHCRMMNWYDVALVRENSHWMIRHLVIDNVWFTGDPNILTGR